MSEARIEPVVTVSLGTAAGQLRAAPVSLGAGAPRAVLTVHAADYDVDPWTEMFFFPTDTPKLTLFTAAGEIVWRKDLGRGVVPGMWFLPVLPFDLDGDGVDEIWFVNNADPEHPLSYRHRVLDRLDARTGETTGQWPWPCLGGDQSLSHTFRDFILGGFVRGRPVLVTAQGTYGDMFLQGHDPGPAPRWQHHVRQTAGSAEGPENGDRPQRRDIKGSDPILPPPGPAPRWQHHIRRTDPGARGSHMCPVTDLDGDGVNEVMWGERCIEFDRGTEKFCCDRETYRGHSDLVQPVLDWDTGQWYLYTCRESDNEVSPRVAVFDATGRRVWGKVDRGHMDMGWVARFGAERRAVAMAIRIGFKGSGPRGHVHAEREEFVFDCLTGADYALPFSTYTTRPVDVNGDGRHEFVRGSYKGDGEVIDGEGRPLGAVGGRVALASKFLDLPGEQLLQFDPDGTVRVWADRNAEDSPAALARYAHPFYRDNQRLSASGSNGVVLGGL
jgi:hypothetical protein